MLNRSGLPVLVVQAESLGALGVIRSLGRAGYPVHACATTPDALGLGSSYAAHTVVCPEHASADFIPWLRAYLAREGIRAIVPSESFLLAIRPAFREVAPLLCCGDREDVVYAGMSKFDLFDTLEGMPHLPPTVLITDLEAPPSREALEALGAPLYLKLDGTYAIHGDKGEVFKLDSAEEVLARLPELAGKFTRALVQGRVAGVGVGAFFLRDSRGRVLAEFMHRRVHEVPHTGGASSLRESFFHRAIRDDALEKLERMQWQGVAMMEYRFVPRSGEFHLMEMNGRFWGSLHLALHAGVDFPRLLLDSFFGEAPEKPHGFPLGVRCRNTFPGELQYVWSRLRDGDLSVAARLWSVAEFFALSLDPRIRTDLAFPGDRGLVLKGIRQAVKASTGLAFSSRDARPTFPAGRRPRRV